MKKNYSGIYLFSDIDGTLGIQDKGIAERNIKAINDFVDNGGTFSIATGRCMSDSAEFIKDLKVNGISIYNNGCTIYDPTKNKIYRNEHLISNANLFAKEINLLYPKLDVCYNDGSGYTDCKLVNEKKNYETCGKRKSSTYENLTKPYDKFIFTSTEKISKEMLVHINSLGFSGIQFDQSCENSFEMLPKGITKGEALEIIIEKFNIKRENTFFIGDNYNDITIFKSIGFAACPSETNNDLKSLCDIILGPCLDGAVADFIQYITTVSMSNISCAI